MASGRPQCGIGVADGMHLEMTLSVSTEEIGERLANCDINPGGT